MGCRVSVKNEFEKLSCISIAFVRSTELLNPFSVKCEAGWMVSRRYNVLGNTLHLPLCKLNSPEKRQTSDLINGASHYTLAALPLCTYCARTSICDKRSLWNWNQMRTVTPPTLNILLRPWSRNYAVLIRYLKLRKYIFKISVHVVNL